MINKRLALVASMALLLVTPRTGSAQFLEDFNAPGDAWESGWLGLNSDLMNFYCGGSRGCTNRGNAPTALWAWGNPKIVVNFNPTFGATISTFSVDVGNFTTTNLVIYDMANNIIYNQPVATNNSLNGGPTYSVNSANGVSRFEFSSSSASGNLNIDNVAVDVVSTPEPASFLLFGTGLLALAAVRRRKVGKG